MTNLNQNGRSMIEMLGVLAIIGVLSVGGIAGYSKAMMKFKTNKTIDQIAMTVTNIRTLYAQQPNYDIVDTIAYDMGVVDDAMASKKDAGENELSNPFGGSYYIASVPSGATGDTTGKGAFAITVTGLPREACMSIATNDYGSNYSSGLLGIAAGTGDAEEAQDLACYVANPNSSNPTSTASTIATEVACATGNSPLSVADAADGCDCSDNNCVIVFKYY